MATVIKPPALDETLQAVNETLGEIRDNMVVGNSYAHKVVSGDEGNLTELTSDGDLADAGVSVDDIVAIAEGKTATYVINISQNAGFNSQADAITVTGNLITTSSETVALSDIKKGDIILVTDTNVPDRWAANESSSSITFYKMETAKIDLTGYYTKTQTDSLLLDKADKVAGATSGHLAGLDSNGNLTDSDIPASDVTQLKNDLSQLTNGFNRTVLQGGFNQLFDMGICFGRSSEFYNFAFDNSSKKINFSLKDSSITWARIPLCLKAPNSKIYVKLISNENIQSDLWYTETDNSDVVTISPLETKATSYIFNNATNKPVLSCHFASQWATHSTLSMGFIVVNLTQWFGAGNEPSIEEVESILTENYYEYNDYVPSLNGLDVEALNIKMLGWSVPKECPIHNYMDANRKFHQKVGRVDLGNLEWRYDSSVIVFVSGNINCKNDREGIPCYSYIYTQESGSNIVSTDKDMLVCVGSTFLVSNAVVVKNLSYTDATAFKSAMNGVYLYYELANEIVTDVDGNEIGSGKIPKTTVITQAELDSALSDDNIGQGVYYHKVINVNAGGLSLEGASWCIEGFKADADYAWQTAKTYAASGIASKSRSKLGGVWNAWV